MCSEEHRKQHKSLNKKSKDIYESSSITNKSAFESFHR